MNQIKAEKIVSRLLSSAVDLKFGSVTATIKIHNSRIVETVFSTTESTRETESDTVKTKAGAVIPSE